jgi:NAD(P)-dependent dehydrogenase (short-subunit alcohol dehydrogenase family)
MAALVARGFGRILLVSSVNAVAARPEAHGHVAAKAGLEGLARGLRVELAPHGIAVNGLAPGCIRTGATAVLRTGQPGFEAFIDRRTPAGRRGRRPDPKAAALCLVAPSSRSATGSVVTLDGA